MGPGPRFELGQEAPQASMLTKLHHPGRVLLFCSLGVLVKFLFGLVNNYIRLIFVFGCFCWCCLVVMVFCWVCCWFRGLCLFFVGG